MRMTSQPRRPRARPTPLGVLATICLLACPLAAGAAEGGASNIVPGNLAALIDLPPVQPGWIVTLNYLNYEGDASAEARLPIVGTIGAKLTQAADAYPLGAFNTFDSKVLGAYYSVGAVVPYVTVDVTAQISTALGTVRATRSASGLGDATLVPAMLAWKDGSWQYSALLSIVAPTGKYDEDRFANPSLNYWTFDPTFGVSYNNETSGFNAALFAGIGFNTENDATDNRSGSIVHLDGSVQQLLPVGAGYLGVGAEVFYIEQVTGDRGAPALLGDFKLRSVGIGPVLTYILPRGNDNLVAELRWLTETSVRNQVEGDYLWFKLVYQFGPG